MTRLNILFEVSNGFSLMHPLQFNCIKYIKFAYDKTHFKIGFCAFALPLYGPTTFESRHTRDIDPSECKQCNPIRKYIYDFRFNRYAAFRI